MNPVRDALDRLFHRLGATAGPSGRLWRPWEADWDSPCVAGGADRDGQIPWRPVRQQPPASFADIENALEIALHPAIADFYGSWWSDHVPASAGDLRFELLFLWNAADLELLKTNIIGHALEKRRAKEPLTVFVACVDDARLISIDNATGAVLLETVGRRGPATLAARLDDFLDAVEPEVAASSQVPSDNRR